MGRVAAELGFGYVLGAKTRFIKRAIGMCPPISKLITSPYASGRTHRVESRTHGLSDVRTERNNAAEHAAEIAVASHRARPEISVNDTGPGLPSGKGRPDIRRILYYETTRHQRTSRSLKASPLTRFDPRAGGPFSATADRGERLTLPFANSLPGLRSYETGGETTLSLVLAGVVL